MGKKRKKKNKVEEVATVTSVWDSELKIIKKIVVHIDYQLLLVCNSIQEKLGNKEFSILAKAQWKDNGFFVTSDYVIPKQEVSFSSVNYKEDLQKYKKEGYNVVIHSHPFEHETDFSLNDIETINTHFTVSILYSNGEFVKAVVPIKINSNTVLQVEAEIKLVSSKVNVDISNIEVKEYYKKFPKYYDNNGFWL